MVHSGTNGNTEQNGNNIGKLVLGGFVKPFYNARFAKQIAKHQKANQGALPEQ